MDLDCITYRTAIETFPFIGLLCFCFVFVEYQVAALAATYTNVRDRLQASSSSSIASPPETYAYTLQGIRQIMAGVVPKLYQLLSKAFEADDGEELATGSCGSDRGAVAEDVRAVLHKVPWLWVGDSFVPAAQASVEGYCRRFGRGVDGVE